MKLREFYENPLGRAIGVRLDGHRPYTRLEAHSPGGLISGQIEHRDHVVGDGAGDSVFAVWGYVDVVELPPDWNAFDKLASRGVDHVEPAFPAPDGPQHAPTVLCHRDIVGTPAEPHLVSDLAAGAIHDIQRVLGFIADVDLGCHQLAEPCQRSATRDWSATGDLPRLSHQLQRLR